jgi:hypothetical protein
MRSMTSSEPVPGTFKGLKAQKEGPGMELQDGVPHEAAKNIFYSVAWSQ